ncbi:hypothetical protein B0H17DRAFT_1211489 [Mycena rosella]|uniref:Uncharacterized protein n=1 Tax=Mycena rosella TaxID=1033263 RepID=A0AAD7G409_MYCRO|nr:hypothetical protein B0H17DRAFT_1211489 [Mycena rosella]
MAQFLHALESKPISFFHTHVRRIYFVNIYPVGNICEVLSACTAATDILASEQAEPALLPLLGTPGDWATWSGLAHMPRLTHLALNGPGAEVCIGVLRHCKFLAVLLIIGRSTKLESLLDPRVVFQSDEIFMPMYS